MVADQFLPVDETEAGMVVLGRSQEIHQSKAVRLVLPTIVVIDIDTNADM